uniref:Interleukin-12 beta central domain-containing protein n=1 Tax=Neogobius melanostomus TaxID=47308 RepID=A0A8C6SNL0_9GOBI
IQIESFLALNIVLQSTSGQQSEQKFHEPELQGNRIQVTVREWRGGNYTCHLGPEGAPLNYTLVMVQLEPDNRTVILEERGYIHCSTPNYRGSFHCSWSRTQGRSDAAVLNQETVRCEVDPDGSGMKCDDSDCPYKEEQYRIILTVYMYSEARLEGYSKAFYIRDIANLPLIIPKAVSLTCCITLMVQFVYMDYPETWEKPCSFFSLLFQVKVVKGVHNRHSCDSHENILNDTTSKTQYEVSTQSKRYVFCVRAQDRHTGGPWGHWNHCM